MDLDGQHRHLVNSPLKSRSIAIIGAGPAGLMAAERLITAGHRVTIYDRMPSPARKFLLAGRGGLNITHSEQLDHFLQRYGDAAEPVQRAISAFPPEAIIAWVHGLGQETFTGSSGRVFPKAMKASPLLRAWLLRLDRSGVKLKTRHTFEGFAEGGDLKISNPAGVLQTFSHDATILALGGASWPKLGSDGSWVAPLSKAGIDITPLTASNAGVIIPWSDHVRQRFAGTPLKRIAITVDGVTARGEAVITASGLEGGAIYALSRHIRHALASPAAFLTLDLRPDVTLPALAERLGGGAKKDSLSNHLRKSAGLTPAQSALLRENGAKTSRDPPELARAIKNVVLPLAGLHGLERAISTAGGIALSELDHNGMLTALPGVFAAGEMLDWDAPTGGYLLTACLATGAWAAGGVERWLANSPASRPENEAKSQISTNYSENR